MVNKFVNPTFCNTYCVVFGHWFVVYVNALVTTWCMTDAVISDLGKSGLLSRNVMVTITTTNTNRDASELYARGFFNALSNQYSTITHRLWIERPRD